MKNLNGLILAGGRSTRMGMDKSHVDFHGMPQYAYLHDVIKHMVSEVFISCRKEQSFELPIPRIEDAYHDIGPMSGILSAFDFNSACAWLVIAVDLASVTEGVVKELMEARDPACDATYFIDAETRMPEPLLAIYEPSIYPYLKIAFQENQFSLNRVLQSCDGKQVVARDGKVLRSVNTMEEYKSFKNRKE